MRQGCLFFHYSLATSTTNWAEIFTDFVILCMVEKHKVWEDWSLTITNNVPSAFKQIPGQILALSFTNGDHPRLTYCRFQKYILRDRRADMSGQGGYVHYELVALHPPWITRHALPWTFPRHVPCGVPRPGALVLGYFRHRLKPKKRDDNRKKDLLRNSAEFDITRFKKWLTKLG